MLFGHFINMETKFCGMRVAPVKAKSYWQTDGQTDG